MRGEVSDRSVARPALVAFAVVAASGVTIWLTGLPCSGKTTVARMVAAELERAGRAVELLDGDVVRTHLSKDLGYTRADRDQNVERIGWVSSRLTRHGVAVVVAAVSPYRETRNRVRSWIEEHGPFVEVWVNASAEACARRDVKGLYAKAFAGELKNMTGVDDPYEPPEHPEVVLETETITPEEAVEQVLRELERRELVTLSRAQASE
jgi:adenylylsulfate kinase